MFGVAVSESFLTFLLEQLDAVPSIVSRRMFGAVGLYAGETFFAVVDNDTLFFKVNNATVGAFVDAGMEPFRPFPDRPGDAMNGYYAVPASVIEDRDELAAWARTAIAVGAASARAKRGRGRDARGAPRRKPARQQHRRK
jgi:DNA transformation protein